MAQFSSSMLLADLDYIAPSQACIKPTLLAQKKAKRAGEGDSQVFLHGKGEEAPNSKEDAIKISLQDCLACSGCVTTSETILVTSQSKEEIENVRRRFPQRPVVVSISDQSAASIAAALGSLRGGEAVSVDEAFAVMSGFCRAHLGALVVCDLRWAQRISLEETAQEYQRRLVNKEVSRLPMIVAACPGWVCYCEKTHPQLMPLLCEVMSPQGVAGSYLKHLHPLAYHISIQPCFDRKLESVREDFRGPKPEALIAMEAAASATAEAADPAPSPAQLDIADEDRMTNCVLSTAELFKWMQEVEGGLEHRSRLDSCSPRSSLRPRLAENKKATNQHAEEEVGSASSTEVCEAAGVDGSGGYHQHCILAAAHNLCGAVGVSWSDLVYVSKRNSNHRVISIEESLSKRVPSAEGAGGRLPLSVLGEACIAYGFQHIQNIVRGINRKLTTVRGLTLIEMMACPEGCLNGGGQVRGATAGANADILKAVKEAHMAGEEEAARVAEHVAVNSPCTHKLPRTEDDGNSAAGYAITYEAAMGNRVWKATPPGGNNADPASQHNFAACRMTFHDRKAEMELADNIVHSLKW